MFEQDSWYKLNKEHRYVDLSDYARPLAHRLVARLRDTPVRSLHVTQLFIAMGLLAAIVISFNTAGCFLLGAALLQLKNLLDAVDGSLARAQKRESRVGRFLDSIGDFFVTAATVYAFCLVTESSVGVFIAVLLSILLQGSYYNYVNVSLRTATRGPQMSQLNEAAVVDSESTVLRGFRLVYLTLYGWQDWLIGHLVGEFQSVSGKELTLISLFGLGTHLFLQAACLVVAGATGSVLSLSMYFWFVGALSVLLVVRLVSSNR